jgi:hypothetical protein
MTGRLEKECFEFLLKVDKTVCSRVSAGRAYQATGPAYKKERSPNFVRSRGMT